MKRLHILAVSGKKDPAYTTLVNTFCERLSPYAKVTVEILPQKAFDSVHERDRVLRAEWQTISARIPKNSSVLLLDAKGKQYASETFAAHMEQITAHGDMVCFVLGGSLGLPEEEKKKYTTLSLSSFTMPHELALVVLLEQLYRAETISRGKQYHY
jgi:23S rRNA (pseudouridine1915-N3)-methyltransferase